MTQLPEHQRRMIVRTAVILAAIALAIFAFTLWRGIR
jgi:small neutral amino acid transporter SnatA (MarC family)